MIKIGDTVRYLNSVGGGKVVRIEGQIAYVDENGFETPAMLRECVVVATAGEKPSSTYFREVAREEPTAEIPKEAPAPQAPEPEPPKIEEVEGGDVMNLVLAFEPTSPKHLDSTSYEGYLVNDSNYFVDFALMSRANDSREWTLLTRQTIEPNIELRLGRYGREDVARMDRLLIQWIAYKVDKPFEAKAPGWVDLKVDTTKFFKLHCFRENEYFDNPVLAFTLIKDDAIATPRREPDAARLLKKYGANDPLPKEAAKKAEADRRKPAPRFKAESRRKGDLLEVDLHIGELTDSTVGMSNADMLNRQIDEFERVMNENLRNHGQKIVFIHGKGEGVLRQALMKELTHRYKEKVDVQDASFREYGFGATQVTIK